MWSFAETTIFVVQSCTLCRNEIVMWYVNIKVNNRQVVQGHTFWRECLYNVLPNHLRLQKYKFNEDVAVGFLQKKNPANPIFGLCNPRPLNKEIVQFTYNVRFLRNRRTNEIIMDSSQIVAITGHQITFQFQLGLVRDRVTVDSNELNLNSLKVRKKKYNEKIKKNNDIEY